MNPLDSAIRNVTDPTRELWAAAAVRESFRAGDLLSEWYGKHGDADEVLRETALLTSITLQDVATPALTSDGAEAFRLPTEIRKRALKGFGVKLAQTALHAVPEERLTPVERILRTMLDGKSMSINMNDREQLAAFRVATSCAVAAGARPEFTEQELDRKVQRLDLLFALGGSDLHRFVGRCEDLEILHKLWRERAGGVTIEGPGGMGKSLLVSRFVSDLLDEKPSPRPVSVWRRFWLKASAPDVKPIERPVAVFHFDFDRRDLQGGNYSSSLDALTNELMRQARRWLPKEIIDKLSDGGDNSSGYELEAQSYSRSTRGYRGRRKRITELSESIAQQSTESAIRILLVFDSMEQILGFDDEAAYAIEHITNLMESAGTQPFVVCVSRSFASGRMIVDWLDDKIDLAQFSHGEARTYLTNEAKRVGITLEEKIIDRVIAIVGCPPLALRLSISLMEKDKEAFDPKHWVKILRDDPERIQASLYDRILKRIRDKDLVKVARPGLLVRRLTRDVISQVLSRPCEIDASEDLAQSLMWKAESEGQLFSVNRSDPDSNALWHRADVRALMLPDLDASIDDDIAKQINEGAIAFYSKSSDLISRTEELYHRLRLAQDAAELDPRWIDSAGAALRGALEELPPQSRAYVRRRLGSASLAGVAITGAETDADLELREVVRRELQAVADGADPLGTLANFGVSHMRGALADLFAEALLSVGQLDELLLGAARLVASRDAPPRAIAAVSNIAGAVLEGLGRLSEAYDYWHAGIDIAGTSDTEEIHIAVAARIGALRTARKQDELRHYMSFESSRARLITETLALAKVVLPTLSRRAVEAREIVAETADPESEQVVPDLLFRIFADLVGSGEAFPSLAERPQRLEECAREFGFQALTVREFSSFLSKMVYGRDQGRVIELMREEVDWTLAHAVNREAQ
ncbi:hypothetical protein ACC728_24995 [Rhizobium ruizarguesonis]